MRGEFGKYIVYYTSSYERCKGELSGVENKLWIETIEELEVGIV